MATGTHVACHAHVAYESAAASEKRCSDCESAEQHMGLAICSLFSQGRRIFGIWATGQDGVRACPDSKLLQLHVHDMMLMLNGPRNRCFWPDPKLYGAAKQLCQMHRHGLAS
eukprot:357110-Amphidinium_carterae.1